MADTPRINCRSLLSLAAATLSLTISLCAQVPRPPVRSSSAQNRVAHANAEMTQANENAQAMRAAEQEIFSLLNRARTENGLPPLVWNESLAEAARGHSRVMAAKSALSHQFDGENSVELRIAAFHVLYSSLGENVAVAATPEIIHDSLMHSPPHRKNILGKDFNAVGIGVIRADNYIYVTQDFAKTTAELTTAQAGGAVLDQINALRRKAGMNTLRGMAFYPESEEARQRMVCEMAKRDRPTASIMNSKEDKQLPVVIVLAFETPDIQQVGSQLHSLARVAANKVQIDLCLAPSASNPSPVWWGVVTLYK